jgi:ribonuclease BN (tRNA processing enzyme)
VNFPVRWDQLGAQVEFKELTLYQPVDVYGMKVRAFALDHPGGSFGYRFEAGGRALAVGFDGEYTRHSREDLGKDLPFYQNLDLLVFDAQYELEELLNKHDWGHSSAPIGIDLALREGIKKLVLVHHDPWASDERLHASIANARRYAKASLRWYDNWRDQPEGPEILSAYDGLVVDVGGAA